MAQATGLVHQTPAAAKERLTNNFRRRGIITAVMSGVTYGNYTAFMTLAMSVGVWVGWYGEDSGLTPFAVAFMLSALGAALTDTFSALWALLIAAWKGKLGDFGRSFKTKPGAILACAALIGGPFASTSYVVGLQQAGSIVVPISALCPAIGAILARILFKQPLTPRMALGILICFGASALIGMTSMNGTEAHPHMLTGLFFGFAAALGWGIEGCVGGYASSMIDPEVSIAIREVTNGFSNLIIMVPILALVGGADGFQIISQALCDFESIKFFIIGGFACYWGFMLWYKGNAMCGAALGMACNGMFSFWGPFFCWIWIGLVFGIDGWDMPFIAWIAALLMIIGIFTIATNPLAYFARKKGN